MDTLREPGAKIAGVAMACYFLVPMYITILILLKKVFIKNASPYSVKTLGVAGVFTLLVIIAYRLTGFPLTIIKL